MDLSTYKSAFLSASREHLKNFSENLEKLSQNPKDAELAAETHRSIHSLGSQCFAMNYKTTGEYARVIENYFYNLKNGDSFSEGLLPVIRDAAKNIEDSLTNIESKDTEMDLSAKEKGLKEELGL